MITFIDICLFIQFISCVCILLYSYRRVNITGYIATGDLSFMKYYLKICIFFFVLLFIYNVVNNIESKIKSYFNISQKEFLTYPGLPI